MRHAVVLSALLLAGAALPVPAAASTSEGRVAVPATAAGGGPLFVQNVGQFPEAVRFQVRSAGVTAWLTRDALWLTYLEPATDAGRIGEASRAPRRGVNLRLTFPGMAPNVRLTGFDRRPTRTNFFVADPALWRSNVPTFGSVRWEGAYPGAALELRGLGADLAASVLGDIDLSRVRLHVEGADALSVGPDGRLSAQTAVGRIALPRFLDKGRPMRARVDGVDVGFAGRGLSQSDVPRVTVTGLAYGTFLGAGQDDLAWRVSLGRDGSIYVAGQTLSPGFPTTPGAFDTTYNSGQFGGDGFVSKLDPTGSTLLYSTFLGGSDTDWIAALAPGRDGNVYVAGYTYAPDFPTTPGSYSPVFNGGCCDGFVTELNADGGDLVYSTFLGGDSFEDIGGMALGHGGTVFVTGETLSADFPTTPGAFDRVINNNGLKVSL